MKTEEQQVTPKLKDSASMLLNEKLKNWKLLNKKLNNWKQYVNVLASCGCLVGHACMSVCVSVFAP